MIDDQIQRQAPMMRYSKDYGPTATRVAFLVHRDELRGTYLTLWISQPPLAGRGGWGFEVCCQLRLSFFGRLGKVSTYLGCQKDLLAPTWGGGCQTSTHGIFLASHLWWTSKDELVRCRLYGAGMDTVVHDATCVLEKRNHQRKIDGHNKEGTHSSGCDRLASMETQR